MTPRTQRWIAWSGVALAVVAAGSAVVLVPVAATTKQIVVGTTNPVFAVAGAVIVARRPGNVVGWLLVGAGVGLAVTEAFGAYAYRGLVVARGSLPFATWAAWTYGWLGVPAFSAVILVLPLVFPDGRLPSRRWGVLLWVIVAVTGVQLLQSIVRPGVMTVTDPVTGSTEVPVATNPLGIAALRGVIGPVDVVINVGFFPILVALVVAIVVRYRRSAGVERYQLRWFLCAVALLPFGFGASVLSDGNALVDTAVELLVLAIPVSIALAVLRYRLYEIDRIISRTATYALVSVALVGVYVAVAVVPSAVLRLESDLLVATATLLAAAVFLPLRSRIQGLVDRRFDRARYDAARIVDGFGARVRGKVDAEAVLDELRTTVAAAVRPAGASVWLVRERVR